ncbi:MAG: hypothetical protein AAF694_12995 [Bacteroidota bacterium]
MFNYSQYLMRTYVSVLLMVCFVGLKVCQAQKRSSKGTEIVFTVDQKSQRIKNIELLSEAEDKLGNFEIQDLMRKYPGCNFYIGLLKGNYEKTRAGIIPLHGTTLTLYTDKTMDLSDQDKMGNFRSKGAPLEKYSPGDQLIIGNVSTQVISNKGKELVLRRE